MCVVDQYMHTHPNSDTLLVTGMDVSNEYIEMTMLTVLLMNPKKMSDIDEKAQ